MRCQNLSRSVLPSQQMRNTISVRLPEELELGDAGLVLDFVRNGLVRPAFTLADHTLRIAELAKRYRDRQAFRL